MPKEMGIISQAMSMPRRASEAAQPQPRRTASRLNKEGSAS
jgi:hypothetical protein